MSLFEYAQVVRPVTRYDEEYFVFGFGRSVSCVLPAMEEDPPETDALLEIIQDMQRKGSLDHRLPVEHGYTLKSLYHPYWPNKGSSTILHHAERDEFLKIPVLAKGGSMQFFAMNAIARALQGNAEASAVRNTAVVRHHLTRSSVLFINGAPGTSARSEYLRLGIDDKELQEEFYQTVKERARRVIKAMPPILRPLMNDNPHTSPTLGVGSGMQNVFLGDYKGGTVDPLHDHITYIDQAHPSIGAMMYHMAASRFPFIDLETSEMLYSNS